MIGKSKVIIICGIVVTVIICSVMFFDMHILNADRDVSSEGHSFGGNITFNSIENFDEQTATSMVEEQFPAFLVKVMSLKLYE